MKFVKFFIDHSKVVNLIVIAITIAGMLIFMYGQKEGFPQINFDLIWIQTTYIGASAEEVEQLITDKIEEAIADVDGAKRISSQSIEGISIVRYEVSAEYSSEFDKIYNDVKNAIDSIRDLPDDAEDPLVLDINFDMFPVISVFLSGDIPEDDLRTFARKVEDDLKEIRGVGRIDRYGYRDKQVWVEVDPGKLKYYDMDITDVIAAIRLRNINLPGGKISLRGKEYLIRTVGEYKDLDQIKNTVVRANDEGNSVLVKDIAKVSWDFKKTEEFERVNGHTGIRLDVLKKRAGDIIKVTDNVKELIERYKNENLLPDKVLMFDANDLSYWVKRRLNTLTSNAFLGLILVFFMLIIFFDWKTTFWTTMGIPVAFCTAMLISYSMGITLNMMTMFGFIIVVGMIVDDAIIVSENIYRHRELGKPLMKAAIEGASEVFKPVLATVITTIAAFMPLTTLPGIMGKFLGIIPIAVSLCMAASFFECMLVLPGHIGHMKDGSISENKKKSEDINKRTLWFKKMQAGYTKIISFLLKSPIKSFGVIFVIFLSLAIILGASIPFKFVHGDVEQYQVRIETSKNNSVQMTMDVIDKAEKALRKVIGTETRELNSTVGYMDTNQGPKQRSFIGSILLMLKSDHKMKPKELREAIETEMDKLMASGDVVEYNVIEFQGGPPRVDPVRVEIYGKDLDEMRNIAEDIRIIVNGISNTTSVQTSWEEGKDEFVLKVDEQRAASLGVNISQAAMAVRYAMDGGVAAVANSMKGAHDDVEILVKYNEKRAKTKQSLDNVAIKNMMGRNIPLDNFAEFVESQSAALIEHLDEKRFIAVTSELKDPKSKYNSNYINKLLHKKLPEWKSRYEGYNFKLGGEFEEQQEMLISALIAGLVAIASIFIILTSLFKSISQPIFVMIVIPFSIVGVLFGLFVHNLPFGMMPIMAIVALMGVVVNDSLVLISFINRLRQQGYKKIDAIVEGGKTRLRPIILTTITTIAGLAPMSFEILGKGESFLRPMGIAFIYGLFFATTITLFILPCIYYIGDEIMQKLSRRFGSKYEFGSLE